MHTERSSHIHSGDLALERQNYLTSETRTLGDSVRQYVHGNHSDSQSRWRKHQPWPS